MGEGLNLVFFYSVCKFLFKLYEVFPSLTFYNFMKQYTIGGSHVKITWQYTEYVYKNTNQTKYIWSCKDLQVEKCKKSSIDIQ